MEGEANSVLYVLSLRYPGHKQEWEPKEGVMVQDLFTEDVSWALKDFV